MVMTNISTEIKLFFNY